MCSLTLRTSKLVHLLIGNNQQPNVSSFSKLKNKLKTLLLYHFEQKKHAVHIRLAEIYQWVHAMNYDFDYDEVGFYAIEHDDPVFW